MKRIFPVLLLVLANHSFAPGAQLTSLNFSCDPRRELYQDYNAWFTSY